MYAKHSASSLAQETAQQKYTLWIGRHCSVIKPYSALEDSQSSTQEAVKEVLKMKTSGPGHNERASELFFHYYQP